MFITMSSVFIAMNINNDANFHFGIDNPYVNNFSVWRVEIIFSCKESRNVSLPLRFTDLIMMLRRTLGEVSKCMCYHAHY